MAYVKFPHSVKFNGKYYAPNTSIEVDDAAEHVERGAAETAKRTGKKKTKSSSRPKADPKSSKD